MKVFFLLSLAGSCLGIAGIIAWAVRIKSIFTRPFVKLSCFTVFVIVMYALTLCPFIKSVGLLTAGLYFAGLDWLLFLFFNYIFFFIQDTRYLKPSRFFKKFYIAVSAADTFSLILNAFLQHAFTITPVFDSKSVFYCWQYHFGFLYRCHLVYCYLIIIHLIFFLVVRSRLSSSFYRMKYAKILFSFVFLVLLNGIFILFKWDLDVSLLVYVFMDIGVFILTFFSIPHHIERGMRISVAQQTESCFVCYDFNGGILYMNDKARKVLKDRADIRDKISEYQKQFILSYGTASHYYTWQYEFENHGNLEIYNFDFNVITDKKGSIIGSYLHFSDMTEEINTIRIQQYNATHDHLTGLCNRQTFFEKAHEILIENPVQHYLLIATDIENFKLINDLFGWETGNEILIQQSLLLCGTDCPGCVTGKISGDKFAILIKKDDFDPECAVERCRKIKLNQKDVDYKIKTYLGVYEIKNHYENVQNMFDKAVLAIRKIHGDYEQTVVYYDDSFMDELVHAQNILNEFSLAIENEEFQVYLQAQFDKESRLRGCEALTRWNHPQRGLLSPSDFVAPLEESGLIYRLDSFIWEKAAQILEQWKKDGIDWYISVNISPKDFYYIDVIARFRNLLAVYDFDPSKLNVEITESFIMNRDGLEMEVIKGLKALGLCIELDDFGSGYSSLKTLEDFDFDVMKLDMEFLSECDDGPKAKSIVLSIIRMAKAMGIRIVTEGVEYREQFDYLCEAGVDLFQGYYFSSPLCVEDFRKKYAGL